MGRSHVRLQKAVPVGMTDGPGDVSDMVSGERGADRIDDRKDDPFLISFGIFPLFTPG